MLAEGHQQTVLNEPTKSVFGAIAGIPALRLIERPDQRLSSGLHLQRERVWWRRTDRLTSEHALKPGLGSGLVAVQGPNFGPQKEVIDDYSQSPIRGRSWLCP
jgi:hypothetical protein